MLMITEPVETIIPALKFPTARRAAPAATIRNCSAIAGMNQRRYLAASAAVSASALIARVYGIRTSIPTIRKAIPVTTASTCAWLNISSASPRFFLPTACDTTVVVPTPSICVRASTMKVKLPAMATAATACVPSLPTQ